MEAAFPFTPEIAEDTLANEPRVVDDGWYSRIIQGDLFSAGGSGYGLLQWRGIKIPGQVTILQNVLEISRGNQATRPV